MTKNERVVIGGVDTHKNVHVAAVIDDRGKILDTSQFVTTSAGYRQLLKWLRSFGELAKVGVEGTGSYGAGLHSFLASEGVEVLDDQDATVCTCGAPKAAEEVAVVAPVEGDIAIEPEVLAKGKKEEEEGAEAAKPAKPAKG